ncbi:unnamed protein product [Rotaria magnacalcarata]|uniref:Uncharacterized protein n=2 Tax=Rotaria magnacalcarata TaxID=392030 RepID=A0A819EEV8_9BILA|nr:unnamed protein product [Rotaria magnacalcarata]CAF3849660.1 unnamed protein product [Rotaria magnacalcarata]
MNKNIIQTILSSTIIKTDSFQSLQLSPNDWIIPSIHSISCVYFYNIQKWPLYEKESNDMFIDIQQLIVSLRKLLEYYSLLNGVFKLFDQDSKVAIEQTDSKGGILFVTATVNISLNELPLSLEKYTNVNVIPKELQLINANDPNTLFHVRHTRFLCGSVALGISLNHQVADAHSYFQLVKDWVQIYKNLEYQPDVCHQRSLLEPSFNEIEILKKTNPNFNDRKSLSVKEENSPSFPQTKQIKMKIFRFSADELNRMKLDSTHHLSPNVDYVSTFDVLTAHIYRHVMIARNYPASSISKLYISTNIRSRLTQPSIPITYFGNAIMFSYLEMNMKELIHENHIGLLASEVHRAIEQNNKDDIRTTLAWILCQKNKKLISPTCNLDKTDFTISAWNKMGMYSDSDFEPGVYPCRITLPADTEFSGAAILFSTEQNDASIDVILGLEMSEMERVEKNFDFRKYHVEI